MDEIAEAKWLMRTLIRIMGTQRQVAKAMNQKPSAFNYLLNHAKTVPVQHLFTMKSLLMKLMAEDKTIEVSECTTPAVDTARLRSELIAKNEVVLSNHFKSVQSVLLPTYASHPAFNSTTKVIHAAVYLDPTLIEAEQKFQLPLRTAFMGLLTCSNQKGHFYWNSQDLKATIFPYVSIQFNQVLDALVNCQRIQKKALRDMTYGYIPLRNCFVYEISPEKI